MGVPISHRHTPSDGQSLYTKKDPIPHIPSQPIVTVAETSKGAPSGRSWTQACLIFLVFAVTGSSTAKITRTFMSSTLDMEGTRRFVKISTSLFDAPIKALYSEVLGATNLPTF